MASGVPFKIIQDVESLDKWLTDVERRVSRSVAASTLTSMARAARTASINEGAGAVQVPTSKLRKRIRSFVASPKRLESGVIASAQDIPETSLGAKQKGHPGARRRSSSAAAIRGRKRRKAQGARPSKPGGVSSAGRGFPHAWIGKRKDGKGGPQVFLRNGTDLEVIKREFAPVRASLDRNYKAQQTRWATEYAKRFTAALRKRGRGGTATFLEKNA